MSPLHAQTNSDDTSFLSRSDIESENIPWKIIQGVGWPPTLRYTTLGNRFNATIEGVVRPVSLTHLTFGRMFDQAIEGVVWPTSLRFIKFGDEFQPTNPRGAVAGLA